MYVISVEVTGKKKYWNKSQCPHNMYGEDEDVKNRHRIDEDEDVKNRHRIDRNYNGLDIASEEDVEKKEKKRN